MRPLLHSLLFAFCVSSVVSAEDSNGSLQTAPPPSLHDQIDRLLTNDADDANQQAPIVDDAGFLRRITLDLAGRIPTVDELQRFQEDPSTDKRERMVHAFLESPEYPRRLRDQMHVMLMERLGDDPAWLEYLETAFRENRPWDQVCREILNPQSDSEQLRGAAWFWTKRLENYGQNPVDHPALARDLGRLFLGVDLQCAQCHDHLFVDDYKQSDFQGLAAFTGHTFIRSDVSFPAVGEKVVESPVEFASVFTGTAMKTGPRLPGRQEVEIPQFEKDEQFELPPDKKTKFPGVPRFRPLALLAEQVTARDNALFARNSVNRFWFVMFGRGLVMPLDLQHSGNPPTHPELLDLLAVEFAAHDFNVKWLLNELALTQAWQRSSRWTETTDAPTGTQLLPAPYAVAWERPLSAEQLLASVIIATGQIDLQPATDSAAAVDEHLQKRRDDHLKKFREAFSNIPRDPEVDFRPSVKAALFLMNDASLTSWFERHPGNTVDHLAELNDAQIPEALYRTVLCRNPTLAEAEFVNQLLSSAGEQRDRTISHLLWGLVASSEFVLNH
ncbi:MAG: DUF1553 domain-containing protein [Planctomycetaceae bacterium]|nr:DUF1553 domain-containing protein [Planctomycetaceae bacterium]